MRQRIVDASPGLRARLSPVVIRELSGRALSYAVSVTVAARESAAVGAGMSLEDSWRAHLREARVPAGLMREEVEAAGLGRLREAAELDA